MTKRILSLLLAFLMFVSLLPVPTHAEDSAEAATPPAETTAETPTDPSAETTAEAPTEAPAETACEICGQTGCTSAHTSWCDICLKDDCGTEHEESAPTEDTAPTEAPASAASTVGTPDSPFRVNIGRQASPNPRYAYGSFPISAAPDQEASWSSAENIPGSSVPGDLVVVILDVYDNGTEYWYKIAPAEGHTLPDAMAAKPWVFQNVVTGSADSDSFLYLPEEPENKCPICGETDCTAQHVQCSICGTYDCTALHFFCKICSTHDCGQEHLYCRECGIYDCSQTHIWCGTCGIYDCGLLHEAAPAPETAPVIPANPTMTPGAEVSIADANGDPVTEAGFVLSEGSKASLSAWTSLTGSVSYQWQICYDRTNDLWADIQGQTGQGILISGATFLNLAVNGEALLRCLTTSGKTTQVSARIPVRIRQESAAAMFARRSGSAAAVPAAETGEDLEKSYIIVRYAYEDGRIAAAPSYAELIPGTAVNYDYPLPVIQGYEPQLKNESAPGSHVSIADGVLKVQYAQGELQAGETVLITVEFTPAKVSYTVVHWSQNVDDDNYTAETEVISSAESQYLTGQTIANVHKEQPGFYPLKYEAPAAAADGSTTIEVYYDRNYYLMQFDLGGGYGVDPIYARYGATIQVDTPTCPGYTFDGWLLNGTSESIPATMPAENRTYTANWTNPQLVNYTVVYWYENADDTNYSLWGSVTKQAVAGTTVSGADDVPASISTTTINGKSVNEKQYFTYNDALTNKNVVINGDGSTTVHVYYSRNYYTLYFKGISGTCVLEEHTHGDGNCNTPLLCHEHDDTCELQQTCTIPEHTHDSSCYTCTEHTAHERGCYKFSETASISQESVKNIYTIWQLNDQQQDANGIVSYDKKYYVKLDGSWYQIQNYQNNTTVTLNCGGLHTHDAGNCTYKDTQHVHVSSCSTWVCPNFHDHTDECYRSCIKYTHQHNENCQTNSNSNIVYVIHAKYNAYIGDIWPTADVFSGLAYWTGTGASNQSSKLMNMIASICVSGGNTFTAYTNTTAYQLNYMFESFDQTSPENGTTRIFWNNKYYDLSTEYSQIAYYRRNQDTWGYKEISGMTAASNTSAQNSNNTFKLYYNRNRHNIYFENTHTGSENPRVATVESVMYGQPLVNYKHDNVLLSAKTAPYPKGLEENVYRFDGWYTSPEGYEGTKYDFSTGTMPDGDLYLYAKWVPIKHTVKFYLDKDKCEAGVTIPQQLGASYERFDDIQVSHGYVIHAIDAPGVAGGDANHPYRNYDFDGWFYMDAETGEEKAFIIGEGGLPVNQDLELYAKWSSNVLCNYHVYYALDADGDGVPDTDADGNVIYIADPTSGSALAGHTRTFDAMGGDALYPDYQEGHFPTVKSHSITIDISDEAGTGANSYTFLYRQKAAVPYTVKYLEAGTGKVLRQEKTVSGNKKAIVTENFVPISGYMPDAYQKTLVVTDSDDNSNVIIFYYEKDELHALYVVNYYIQELGPDLQHAGWSKYRDLQSTGDIGTTYSQDAIAIDGFTLSRTYTNNYNTVEKINGMTGSPLPGAVSQLTDGRISGTLTNDGMELNFYYTRNLYPYEFRFMLNGTSVSLAEPVFGKAAFDTNVTQAAKQIEIDLDGDGIPEDYQLYDPTDTVKRIHITMDGEPLDAGAVVTQGQAALNVATFYYVRCTQTLTVTKEVTGQSAGLDPEQEFTFILQIHSRDGYHQTSYPFEMSDGSTGTLSPELSAANNTLKFSLKKGQTIQILELPTAEYTITELDPPDSCIVSYAPAQKNKLTVDAEVNITVTNSFAPTQLTIRKQAVGGSGEDVFLFHIQGVDEANAHVDMDVTVTGSGSITIHDLPLGKYTVTEDTAWSWRYEADPGSRTAELTPEQNQQTLEFTNTHKENRWLNYVAKLSNVFSAAPEN